MDIQLGCQYQDRITGFKGTATGFCKYLSGCNQVLLVPKCKETGEHQDGHWFDVQRVTRLAGPAVSLDNRKTPGFDTPAPK
jgi:hypothetical protein